MNALNFDSNHATATDSRRKASAKATLLSMGVISAAMMMGVIGLWSFCPAKLTTDGTSTTMSPSTDKIRQEETGLPQEGQRQLTRIRFFGREPALSDFPLPLCGGDCDGDSECDDGLVCFRRDAGDPIPGCESEGRLNFPTDFCVSPDAVTAMTVADTSELWFMTDVTSPTPSPSTALRGTVSTEAPTFPDESKQVNRYVPTATPHTVLPTFEFRGPPTSSAPTSETWGVLMNNTDPVQLEYVGNDNDFGDASYPLGPCQGDCDRDKDCLGELECFQRNGGEAVPGCIGIDDGRTDYCAFPDHFLKANETQVEEEVEPWQNGFQIKLYWEEGYLWQNETIERKWCISRDYEGSPVTGKCWFGDFSLPCNASETYVSRCSDPENPDPKQLFDFVPVSSDEVLIQAHNEDRCFHRVQRNVTLETCNATNHRQRWIAVRGGFNERKFELSQKRVSKWCLNQDHHPKYGEQVRMYECEKVRHKSHETSWFNLY